VKISTATWLWLVFLSAWQWAGGKDLEHAQNVSRARRDTWAASWTAAPAFAIGPELVNQTIRQTVRLSAGGNRIRVRFSNENKANAFIIGAARLALPGQDPGTIDVATDHALTFNGQSSVSVPAGAPVYSDPLDLKVAPLSALTVSIFVTRYTGPSTIHPEGHATAYISGDGDFTSASIIPAPTTSTSRIFLSEVDVASAGTPMATIVALGDSITDGANSTIDENRRWP
jgi:hypothetical protein